MYIFLELVKKKNGDKNQSGPFPFRIFLTSIPEGNFLCVLGQLGQVYHITAPWQFFCMCEDSYYIFFEPSLHFLQTPSSSLRNSPLDTLKSMSGPY